MIELRDEFSHGQPDKVCWISQHLLTAEQEKVIYYLHRQNVVVRHYNIIFNSPEEMVYQLRHFSKTAVIYTVVPKIYLEDIKIIPVPDISFRTMSGYPDQDNNFKFSSIIEHNVVEGSYQSRTIFNSGDLSFYLGRDSYDPAILVARNN